MSRSDDSHPRRPQTSASTPSGTPAARRSAEQARNRQGGANARPHAPWRQPESAAPSATNPDPATPLEEVRLAIGRLVGAHGVRGEVKLEVYTDEPERLTQLRRVYFDDDPTPQPVKSVRMNGRQALFTFPNITDRDSADALRGTLVRIAGSQVRPPDEGEFYHYQLIGLHVYTEDGAPLGTLAEIITAGEVDVYVARDERGNEHLFPALKDVVLEIDPAADRIIVRPQVWEDEPRPTRERPQRPPRPRRQRGGAAPPDTSSEPDDAAPPRGD